MNEIYYKTTVTFDVLSEKPISNLPPEVILKECNEGEFVMGSYVEDEQIRTPEEMFDDLLEAGSTPDFFMIELGA